jgi:hypothetical protein
MVSQWLTGRSESPNGAGRGFHPQPNPALRNIPPHLCAGAQYGRKPAWSWKRQPGLPANLLIGGNGAAVEVRRRCFARGASGFSSRAAPYFLAARALHFWAKQRGFFGRAARRRRRNLDEPHTGLSLNGTMGLPTGRTRTARPYQRFGWAARRRRRSFSKRPRAAAVEEVRVPTVSVFIRADISPPLRCGNGRGVFHKPSAHNCARCQC